jgi:DNA-directed RNA polymerase subunit H (RpoH/RPB5)
MKYHFNIKTNNKINIMEEILNEVLKEYGIDIWELEHSNPEDVKAAMLEAMDRYGEKSYERGYKSV